LNAGIASSFLRGSQITGIRAFEQGVFLGSGLQINNFLFDLRYEVSNGYSPFQNQSTGVRTFFILTGFKI